MSGSLAWCGVASPTSACCWHAVEQCSIYCVEMMAELSRKLREPFGFSESHLQAVLADYRRISEQVQITGTLQLVTEDPDDDKFIECALVRGATAIGSGDHHLLNLEKHEGIAIFSAADFLDRVAQPAAP